MDHGDQRHSWTEAAVQSLLHERLAECHKSYACRLKLKKGGHSRALYRRQMWTVPIEDGDVVAVALQQQVIELTNKLATVARERKENEPSHWYVCQHTLITIIIIINLLLCGWVSFLCASRDRLYTSFSVSGFI